MFKISANLLYVRVHVVELAVKTFEPHDLVGDLLRESSDCRVLDVAEEMLDTDFFCFFGADLRLYYHENKTLDLKRDTILNTIVSTMEAYPSIIKCVFKIPQN